jgi:hypothetical protein
MCSTWWVFETNFDHSFVIFIRFNNYKTKQINQSVQVPGVRTVPMTSLNGNKFICSIPPSADPTDLASLQASLAADIKDNTKAEIKKPSISAEQLLFEKLRRNLKGHCLEKVRLHLQTFSLAFFVFKGVLAMCSD